LQGTEREAAELFRQMMKGVFRVGLLEAMNEEVTALRDIPLPALPVAMEQ
jgi:putative transposase